MNTKELFGLSHRAAESRLEEFGTNELKVKIKIPLWKKLLAQFTDLMVLILIGAAVISMIVAFVENELEQMTDAYVILGIVVLNAFIGFFQEYKTEKALEALKKLITPRARVLRDGQESMIDAKALVPGDILILAEGDKVSADALLIEANELHIEESTLTGESVPVHKIYYPDDQYDVDTVTSMKAPFRDFFVEIGNENKIFMGTSIVSGSGKAVVIHTGMKTKFGEIAKLTVTTEKDLSPLQKELHRIGVFVGKVTFLISGILFAIGILFQGQSFINSLLFSVSVAVAAVPEGLPATITIALAIGVQRMARKNAIIKQLSSVETLGSTTVICSDKTGTLTKNEMTVKQVYFPAGYGLTFQGAGYKPVGQIFMEKINGEQEARKDFENVLPKLHAIARVKEEFMYDVQKMMDIITICNDSQLVKEDGKWSIVGDPTEAALLVAAKKAGHSTSPVERIKNFPFESFRKRMSVIVKDNSNYELYVKGAPDSIINLCTHIQKEGKVVEISESDREEILEKNDDMADSALRIIGVAYKPLDAGDGDYEKTAKEDVENKLVFVGLIGMIDPPRPEVKEAVKLCHKAGIRSIVITGDFGKTAVAIARELKMVNSKKVTVITGDDLKQMNDDQLKKTLKEHYEVIFARVSPEHKLRIVDVLKQLGEIVAVTGDGVNDAPALKRSDIGVAMGIAGTDVSKEAANMILTDDSFASIVAAVREGRTIYQNLRKFVWYIFSCNIGELTTIFLAIILQIPAPLTAVLILAVDLGTDVLPALALGVDPEEPGIMDVPPRDPKARIMNKSFIFHFLYLGLAIGVIVLSAYLWDLYSNGWTWGETLAAGSDVHLHGATVAFATLVIIQMVNAFNARSEKYSVFRLQTNYYLWGAIFSSCVMVILFVHVPFFQKMLHTVHLSVSEWIAVIVASFSVLFIEEMRKAARRAIYCGNR